MNKFDLINKVLMSDLKPEDKCLLIELITRADSKGMSHPSVHRLCKARGIKHEKNFKGADHYLPGLVSKVKRGKYYIYKLNTPAIEGVTESDVTRYQGSWKQRKQEVTPAVEELTPAVEGALTPAVADLTPAVEGVDSTVDSSKDITVDTSIEEAPVVAIAPPVTPLNQESSIREGQESIPISLNEESSVVIKDSSSEATPAVEGVKPVEDELEEALEQLKTKKQGISEDYWRDTSELLFSEEFQKRNDWRGPEDMAETALRGVAISRGRERRAS